MSVVMQLMLQPEQSTATATTAGARAATATPPDVSVCIVSWNVKDLLRDCLNSLKAQAGNVRYETIVVDNLSGDGSAEMVRTEFPWVKLIDPGANLGFGRANNLAY